MERAPAAPRVYVPLNVAEGTVPTYAVLEFVGLSSPVLQQHQAGLPPPSSSATASSLALSAPRGAATQFTPLLHSSSFVALPLNPVGGCPRPNHQSQRSSVHGGQKQEIIHVVDSPPSSPPGKSSSGPCSSSSSLGCSREIAIVPAVMESQSSGMTLGTARSGLPPLPPSENGILPQPPVSVSQTDRGTVVLTHSSNFRDVVQQLTGASSDDQSLLPVTLPARLSKRVNNVNPSNAATTGTAVTAGACSSKQEPTIAPITTSLGLRKTPLKLHERRKAMRSLEKLSAPYSEVPKLAIPSPVTPLASDFERFCTATTPTLAASISPIRSPVEVCGRGDTIEQERLYMLGKRGPTLLNLFPESPVASPKDL